MFQQSKASSLKDILRSVTAIALGICVSGSFFLSSTSVQAADLSQQVYVETDQFKSYNPSTKVWKSLGYPNLTAWSVTTYNGSLFFGMSDGRVLSYNKTSWTDYGDKGSGISAMEVFNNTLYLAQSNGFKSYNGSTWTDLGYRSPGIASLKTYNGKLYAGMLNGCFDSYNGSTWTRVGCFLNYKINELEVFENKLWLGEGSVYGHVYTYDGQGVLDQGQINTGVEAMQVLKGKLYLAGQTGEVFVREGANWKNLGDKGRQISEMATNGEKLFTVDSNGDVRSFDGTNWAYLGDAGSGSYVIAWY